jgi:ATP-dependent helicase Lhr and Lhr-like helicase
VLDSFHPAVGTWFARRFPAGPTTPQAAGWREIAAGRHTLIAAPTGSGKTLAAFLVCIDRIYRALEAGADQAAGPQVVYVSPLKALAVDIWHNLEAPLAGIAEVAAGLGLAAPDIRVAVRTGDTAAAERAAMLKQLGRLDPAAIERVAGQVRPDPRGPDELHDLLMTLTAVRPAEDWRPWFDELTRDRRAVSIYGPAGVFWCAVERRPAIEALFPDAAVVPDHPCPVPAARAAPADPDVAAADMLRGHLDCRGPSAIADLAQATGLPHTVIETVLARLEEEGFAIRGRFTGRGGGEEFCARRLLARIHVYTRQRQRREIEPVTARDFMRFLLRWQRIAPGTRGEGRRGVLSVIEQLQGYELAAGAWENAVLAGRVDGYRREWLDEACLSGQVTWGRLSVRDIEPDPAPRRSGLVPSRATPITLTIRDDLPWLLRAARGDQAPAEPGPGRTRDVLDALRQHGALFRPDLAAVTGRLPSEVEEALWDGVARGLVTADGFRAVRSLLRRGPRPRPSGLRGLRQGRSGGAGSAGRWSLLPSPSAAGDRDELAEAVAEQLVARWGVVFRDLMARENLAVPWREILWAFRRMEARGTIRGGRFVAGFSGEQFAHPDAIDVLRAIRKQHPTGEPVQISAADPLNLTSIVLPGPRVPAIPANTVTYIDGAVRS